MFGIGPRKKPPIESDETENIKSYPTSGDLSVANNLFKQV